MPATRVYIFAFRHNGKVDTVSPTDWLQAWEGGETLGKFAGWNIRFAMVYLSTKKQILRMDTFKQRVTPEGSLLKEDAIARARSVWIDGKLPSTFGSQQRHNSKRLHVAYLLVLT